MPDSNLIMRYLKVRALAEQGVPGERDNAARKMAQMEAENPGLREAADQFLRAQNHGPPLPGQSPFAGNWESVFDFAQQFYHFTQQAMNAQLGTFLARQVTPYTKWVRSTNRFIVGLKMEQETYDRAQHMNPLQRTMFRAEMHAMLDELLDEMLD